ncbi:BNR repeat-containing protein (plasmid) [Alkalihalophilus pseudofirmus OF4]|uniref:BNR repeat-containing protein n=1 Tax=Alkalihalophilus pseudofirmus (strain ATCC BAA-2126 / JCM 17055 / OF4) TaxID=398511 RepID=D3G159_ALKPO|nr:YCF48-related protein [Alkalihalophilus pseudofirmus]ADC52085.1 BNR repeat-containing protein [Alkalihalophilus pseudofirmus OF4]
MKKGLIVSILTLSFFVMSACSSDTSQVDSFMHIHGLEYSQHDESIFVATHNGLLNINESGWELVGEPEHQHDFMGYTIKDENVMISSGHPSIRSDYVDPLGVIISHDSGETWEPIALYEEVDFHLLHVNEGNREKMYGIDVYNSNLYRSENGGHDWKMVDTDGLPGPVASVLSLTSHPQSPDYLLAGTETGLYESSDGGQTWALKENNLSASSFQTLDSDSEELVAYLFGEKEGLYLSEDFGETWASLNFKIDDDYIMYISNHPADDQKLVLGSMNQSIYETNDFGRSWELLAEEGKRKN